MEEIVKLSEENKRLREEVEALRRMCQTNMERIQGADRSELADALECVYSEGFRCAYNDVSCRHDSDWFYNWLGMREWDVF